MTSAGRGRAEKRVKQRGLFLKRDFQYSPLLQFRGTGSGVLSASLRRTVQDIRKRTVQDIRVQKMQGARKRTGRISECKQCRGGQETHREGCFLNSDHAAEFCESTGKVEMSGACLPPRADKSAR